MMAAMARKGAARIFLHAGKRLQEVPIIERSEAALACESTGRALPRNLKCATGNAISPGTAARGLSSARHFFADNLHRYTRHSAYDFSLRGVVKPSNILVGMRVGNYD